jgi:aryl-alcohol dehydrogenase-like predicted oxidoreductase
MNSPSEVCPLGSTGMRCHPLGFGCYRIADGNAEHESALRNYLDRGGNLIDTSANYTDGQSEILVGKVVKSYPRDRVIVVTKEGTFKARTCGWHNHSRSQKSLSMERESGIASIPSFWRLRSHFRASGFSLKPSMFFCCITPNIS